MNVAFSDVERFCAKVTFGAQHECWLWKRPSKRDGYGRFWWNGRKITAHRFAFLAFGGVLAANEEPDHLCRNHSCANPAHLEAVTRLENLKRGNTLIAMQLARTACVHGHEYTPANTRTTKGYRECRACAAAYQRRLRAIA